MAGAQIHTHTRTTFQFLNIYPVLSLHRSIQATKQAWINHRRLKRHRANIGQCQSELMQLKHGKDPGSIGTNH